MKDLTDKKYTIEDYAKEKKLQIEFLEEIGLKNAEYNITIPYYNEDKKVLLYDNLERSDLYI